MTSRLPWAAPNYCFDHAKRSTVTDELEATMVPRPRLVAVHKQRLKTRHQASFPHHKILAQDHQHIHSICYIFTMVLGGILGGESRRDRNSTLCPFHSTYQAHKDLQAGDKTKSGGILYRTEQGVEKAYYKVSGETPGGERAGVS